MKLLSRKRKRSGLVSILGSGPAGLFAAQAVQAAGYTAQIWALGQRSPLYGAQYLHRPIPGLDCGREENISYTLRGTADGYRRKVYGLGASLPVSPETLAPIHSAWDIRSAYAQAWERFHPIIAPTKVDPQWLKTFGEITDDDLVIWTLPLIGFCVGGHRFSAQEVWAQGDAPELGRYCSVTVPPWTIVTNGEDSPRWYRASNVFGYRTAEWPGGVKPPVEGIARATKPITTDCSCWLWLGRSPVLRVGRYGTWTKGELSHQAYFKTLAALEAM